MDDAIEQTQDADYHGELIDAARQRYDDAIEADESNRERAEEDLRFTFVDQWDEADRRERETLGLPCFEINDLPQFISQVAGDIRLNKPQINVHPVENTDRMVADVYEGIIRSIEQASSASRVYSEAAEAGSLSCGRGHWRLSLDYNDDETFDLDARIESIPNPLSVIWDPNAKKMDMSDARYCFVVREVEKDQFAEAYPTATASHYYDDHKVDGQWKTGNTVTVAEYWTCERKPAMLHLLPDGRTVTTNEPLNIPVVRSRQVMRKKVQMHLITGREVLEGPFNWPGQRIPIFTVWGRVGHVGEQRVVKSLIHNARDAVRMYNYTASQAAENIGKAPKAKWLGTAKMFEGNEEAWRNAGRVRSDALVYNPDPNAPQARPEMIPPVPVDGGILQERMNASEDKKRTIGIYDASLGNRSNETSGVAIQRRDQQADIANYVFTDNLNLAIEATGRELVAIIPHIYDAPRQLRILGPDMEPQIVAVNQQGGIDITTGKYDVVINTGPGFNTRRQEAADFYARFIQSNQQYAPFVAPIILKNMDYPGYEEFEQAIAQANQMLMQPPQPNPADLLNHEKDKADLEGKRLINMQRMFDLAQTTGLNAFGPMAPAPMGLMPQRAEPLV